jgi:serine/threonine protein kinase/Tfp pilus assembly protein PilF/DNA-directed RNA polymerase subunit RPC12/RpoP
METADSLRYKRTSSVSHLVEHEKQFYKLTLKKKKITKPQILTALKHQKKNCPEKHIAEVLIEQGILQDEEVIELLGRLFRYEVKTGRIDPEEQDQLHPSYFLEQSIITKPQLERCRQHQKEHQKEGTPIPLWQVMLSLGVLELSDLLKYQKRSSQEVPQGEGEGEGEGEVDDDIAVSGDEFPWISSKSDLNPLSPSSENSSQTKRRTKSLSLEQAYSVSSPLISPSEEEQANNASGSNPQTSRTRKSSVLIERGGESSGTSKKNSGSQERSAPENLSEKKEEIKKNSGSQERSAPENLVKKNALEEKKGFENPSPSTSRTNARSSSQAFRVPTQHRLSPQSNRTSTQHRIPGSSGKYAVSEEIYYLCIHCGTAYERSKLTPGKRYKCKKCEELFVLPIESRQEETLRSSEDTEQRELELKLPRRTSAFLQATGPSPEDELFSKYEILGEIAEGAMGIVYKARQIDLNRLVALKVLKDTYSAHLGQVKRFKRESESAAALRHPNIVTIYESGECGGCYYYTMEYVEGEPLMVAINERKLPLRKCVQILAEIVEGMAYAHSQGFIHRDIKPANIILDKENRPKITDFGLVKVLDKEQTVLSLHGQAIGTPNYMPPEQAKGDLKAIDERSDVYALGILLYEILTKKVPFTGKSNVEIYRKIVEEEPREPRALNRNCPKELNTICLKAIQKEKENRYPGAKEFLQDLRAYLEDKPIEAKSLQILLHGKIFPFFKKNRNVLILSLLWMLIFIVVFYFQRQKTKTPENASKNGLVLPHNNPSNEIDKLFYQGVSAWEDFNFEAGIQSFEKFVNTADLSHKEAFKARLYLARCLYYQGKYPIAEIHLDEILAKSSEDDSAYTYALFYKGACLLRQNQYEGAIDRFKRATKLALLQKINPARFYYYLAWAYYQSKEYELADNACSEAIKANPQYYLAYCSRGLISLRRERIWEAPRDFRQAIQLKPHLSISYLLALLPELQKRKSENSQKEVLQYLQKVEETQIHILSSEEIHKKNYHERLLDGLLFDLEIIKNYTQELQPDEYEPIFRKLMTSTIDFQIESTSKAFYRLHINIYGVFCYLNRNFGIENLSYSKLRTKMANWIITSYMIPSLLNPLLPELYFYKARCALEEEKYEDAHRELKSLLNTQTNDPRALALQAWVYVKQKEYTEAEKIYEKIKPVPLANPIFTAQVCFEKGYLAFVQEHFETAISHFKTALESLPSSAESHYYLAQAYLKMGDKNKAIEHLKEAVNAHYYYSFVFQEIEKIRSE